MSKIRLELDQENTENPNTFEDLDYVDAKPFTQFTRVTEDEVRRLVKASPVKTCPLDPIPTWLLKLCTDELVPAITEIINTSISTGYVANSMKEALISPLLKKSSLEPIFKNFRPVSNLSFVSKLVEKVVASQLKKHMMENNLLEKYQSAYRPGHSTETAPNECPK